MSHSVVIHGRYIDHTFIPAGELPDIEGAAELIITQSQATPTSMFDLFGKAARQRSAEDIASQVQEERNEWGEP